MVLFHLISYEKYFNKLFLFVNEREREREITLYCKMSVYFSKRTRFTTNSPRQYKLSQLVCATVDMQLVIELKLSMKRLTKIYIKIENLESHICRRIFHSCPTENS